ncbi:PREDICTED: uncharacterized protein LOC101305108 [Fragaria vesca subsp. vesca]
MTVSSENAQEIWGFLRLVDAYGLSSMYDVRELQSLLGVVQKPKQASQLSRDLGIKDNALGTSIISSLIKTEEPESSLAINAATLSFPNSSSQNDMSAFLSLVSDPAAHVLNGVRGSFSRYWTNEDVRFKEHIMLNNMAWFKCLTVVSRHIEPQVKEDAKHLAAEWKAKMIGNTENSVGTLGFLMFISTYGLVCSLDTEETINLLGVVSQNKRALDFCHTHGFAEKIADFIRNLIERKQVMDAIGFICTFNLADKIPVIPLLKQYVEDAKKCSEVTWSLKELHEEKVKIVDNHISDLRAGKQCIQEYSLESEDPYADIDMQIAQLEILKDNWRRSAPTLGSNIAESQVQRKRKKPNTSSFACEFPSQQ